jgi:glycosyltransferase involved in cell wall biosynthesis
MKILYDHQAFALQKRGGVSRYFFALVKNFKKYKKVDIKLALTYSDNQYLKEAEKGVDNKIKDAKTVDGWQRNIRNILKNNKLLLSLYIYFKDEANKINSLKELKKNDFDIFHPTYYDPYFLKDLGNKPFVLTVHDMIHEIFPEYFKKDDLTGLRKKILIQKAEKVIAVSENTKKDILKFINVPPEKIHVIHHANYMDNKNLKELDLPALYILFVGGRRRYKNFNYFIESLSKMLEENRNLYVVCFGGGNFSSEETLLFKSLNISNNLIYIEGDDESLAYTYKHAICLALPSLYEGFGIPILEAFSWGCPVALSEASCFPEIAQDGGAYFDPQDRISIKNTIDELINNKDFREELIKKGFERLKDFSEEKMISDTYEVYKKCLAE